MARKKKINPAEDNHWQDEMTKIFSQDDTSNIVCNLLLLNNGVHIAFKMIHFMYGVYDTPVFDNMVKSIANSSYIYGSCLRHSNMVLYMCVSWNRQYLDNLIDVLDAAKNTELRWISRADDSGRHIIIGGNWQSFIDLSDKIDSDNNAVMAAICEQIYSYIPRDFAVRASLKKKLDSDRFANIDLTELTRNYSCIVKDNIGFATIASYDRADTLIDKVKEYAFNPSLFSYTDLLDFLTVSFNINSIPYCDIECFKEKNTVVNSKPVRDIGNVYTNIYDPKRRYKLKFNGTQILMSIREFAINVINSINQLTDDKQSGPYDIKPNAAKYLYPLGSIMTNVFVTATFRDILTILLKNEEKDISFMTDILDSLYEYFKNILWPVEEYVDKYETYYSALAPDSESPFHNKIVQDQQQSIDLMENEVAEVLSPEELERLYIKTIEMDDIGQNEPTQGEE